MHVCHRRIEACKGKGEADHSNLARFRAERQGHIEHVGPEGRRVPHGNPAPGCQGLAKLRPVGMVFQDADRSIAQFGVSMDHPGGGDDADPRLDLLPRGSCEIGSITPQLPDLLY